MEVCSTGLLFGGKTVFIIVVRGGYLSVFVWVVGSCLAVSGYEVLIGIDVYKIVGYLVQCAKFGLSPPLVQGCLPAVIVGHESCCTCGYVQALQTNSFCRVYVTTGTGIAPA